MKTKKKLSRNARIWTYFIICALIVTVGTIVIVSDHLILATFLAVVVGMEITLIIQTIIDE